MEIKKRPGAPRKSEGDKVQKITISLSPWAIAWLKRKAGTYREILERLIKKEKNNQEVRDDNK